MVSERRAASERRSASERRTAIAYALFFAIPSGTAIGSGIWLMTREIGLGLAVGLTVGVLVFALVILGRVHGSADERLAEGP